MHWKGNALNGKNFHPFHSFQWVEAKQKFTVASKLINAGDRNDKLMWNRFWSAHQRFFKYLCIASKVEHAARIANESIEMFKCVVIGLQSTGELQTREQLDQADSSELSDFVSTAMWVKLPTKMLQPIQFLCPVMAISSVYICCISISIFGAGRFSNP